MSESIKRRINTRRMEDTDTEPAALVRFHVLMLRGPGLGDRASSILTEKESYRVACAHVVRLCARWGEVGDGVGVPLRLRDVFVVGCAINHNPLVVSRSSDFRLTTKWVGDVCLYACVCVAARGLVVCLRNSGNINIPPSLIFTCASMPGKRFSSRPEGLTGG